MIRRLKRETLAADYDHIVANGKRIWVDLEHQKAAVMLNPLIRRLKHEGADLFITARDMGNNRQVMDELGLRVSMVGKHGGETLAGKMQAYTERVCALLPLVCNYQPDLFFTFSSVEGIRIAFGLQIPSVSFNDEPRSTAVARLTLPLSDKIITPKCIPAQEYHDLGASKDRLVRYDGIDEIAWIAGFEPHADVLDACDVDKGQFVLLRAEMTHAEYLSNTMPPEQSAIADFLPPVVKAFPNHKYFVIPRLEVQFTYLQKKLAGIDNVVVAPFVPRIQDLMFYSAFVASGGGTIVRESTLLGVPSIEFFPGETAPQEHFLMDNGFSLWHLKDPKEIAAKAIEILSEGPGAGRFTTAFRDGLAGYENPLDACYREINKLQTN